VAAFGRQQRFTRIPKLLNAAESPNALRPAPKKGDRHRPAPGTARATPPAGCFAVELGEATTPVEAAALAKPFRLAQAILTPGCIKHQQRFPAAEAPAGDDAPPPWQFFIKLCLVWQPAGRVVSTSNQIRIALCPVRPDRSRNTTAGRIARWRWALRSPARPLRSPPDRDLLHRAALEVCRQRRSDS